MHDPKKNGSDSNNNNNNNLNKMHRKAKKLASSILRFNSFTSVIIRAPVVRRWFNVMSIPDVECRSSKAEQRTVTLATTNSWRLFFSYLIYSLFASIIHLATWQLKQL